MFEGAFRDVRHAVRSITRAPLLSAVIVISLGVGIGVNTTVFSWMQGRVLRPLPGVADATRFVLIEPRGEAGSYPGISWPEYDDLRDELTAFSDILAFRIQALTVGRASEAERTSGLLVSGNYFTALGVRPALGRFIEPDEASRAGGDPVVVISHGYWHQRFAGSPAAVGQTLLVNDRPLTIVGVTPEAFPGTVIGMRFDLWVPATLAPLLLNGSRELDERSVRGYQAAGKLRPGATPAQAQTALTAAMRRLATTFPATNHGVSGEVLAFWESPRGPQRMLVRALVILQGLMLVLLLAVCGNTATLLLARATARQREAGVRLAVGANRLRVARLQLIEAMIIALLGAALGGGIAVWATPAIRAIPLTTGFPVRMTAGVDGSGLAVAAALGVLCALLAGAAPAAQLARVDPLRALGAGGRATARGTLGNLIMGTQVALALVVLIAAGLFLRNLTDARGADPGFTPEGVLLAQYDLTGRSVTPSSAREFVRQLLEAAHTLPEVEAAAVAQSVPLDIHGLPLRSFTLEGRSRSDGGQDRALSNVVTPGYFAVMRIPLLAGADFAALADTAAPAQAIVNQEFVRRYLPGAQPLGRRLSIGNRGYTIVAVAGNSVNDAFGEPPIPCMYFSYRDRPAPVGQIHLRTRPDREAALTPALRRVVAAIDPALPVYDVRALTDHIETSLALRKIPARMFLVLGPLLLALAAIGIYAVVAYSVAQRTAEIGVRLALGATARRVSWQIVGETMRVVAAGAAAGGVVAQVGHARIVEGPPDIAVFTAMAGLLLVFAAVASWVPAARAAGVDPATALRTS